MGNEAIALGALAAGLNVIAGYPGTPSSEVIETVAKRRPSDVYVEWSVNEKAGMEVVAGAAYSGAYKLLQQLLHPLMILIHHERFLQPYHQELKILKSFHP